MPNFKNDPVVSVTDDTNTPAVQGESSTLHGTGVSGRSKYAAGVLGESAAFNGILGVTTSEGHAGVAGVADTGTGNGVYGRSKNANGVIGFSASDGHAGVAGANDDGNGNGVYGRSAKSDGVAGVTTGDGKAGVAGVCDTGNGNGVYGRSQNGEGVHGETQSATFAAIAAFMLNPNGVGAALHAENRGHGVGVFAKGGRLAGLFEGDVEVTGDIRLINAADCAEDFDIADADSAEPGTVMVLGDEGTLHQSQQPYDKRVAGVVSGAGEYKPGIVLDKQES